MPPLVSERPFRKEAGNYAILLGRFNLVRSMVNVRFRKFCRVRDRIRHNHASHVVTARDSDPYRGVELDIVFTKHDGSIVALAKYRITYGSTAKHKIAIEVNVIHIDQPRLRPTEPVRSASRDDAST